VEARLAVVLEGEATRENHAAAEAVHLVVGLGGEEWFAHEADDLGRVFEVEEGEAGVVSFEPTVGLPAEEAFFGVLVDGVERREPAGLRADGRGGGTDLAVGVGQVFRAENGAGFAPAREVFGAAEPRWEILGAAAQ